VPERSKGKLLCSVLWRGEAGNRFSLSDLEEGGEVTLPPYSARHFYYYVNS